MKEPKRDCFGFKNSSYCGVMTEMICAMRDCSFYKTKEQFKKDKLKYGAGEDYAREKAQRLKITEITEEKTC